MLIYVNKYYNKCSGGLLKLLIKCEDELEKEKDVVIEEINKNMDESIFWAHDLLETQLFGNHQLAHFILGTKQNIRDLNRKQLLKFYQKYYVIFFRL